MNKHKIAVAGTGYVGLSLAVLLAQHNDVTAVDIVEEKANLINSGNSPIADNEIEKYLANGNLNLIATLDAEAAFPLAIPLMLGKSTAPKILFLVRNSYARGGRFTTTFIPAA